MHFEATKDVCVSIKVAVAMGMILNTDDGGAGGQFDRQALRQPQAAARALGRHAALRWAAQGVLAGGFGQLAG